jgi:hypothetical protein
MLSQQGDHVTAFFWSPDGTQIAYLTYTDAYDHEGQRTWHIVDIARGTIRDLATFKPSAAFVGLQDFFDAYTFSFSPWSPDSSRIAYGAQDGVYVLDLAAGRAAKMCGITLVANQEEDNYLLNYHAMSDTFDNVDLARLKKHVAEAAAMTFAVADAPERIGPRLNRDQIAVTLHESKLDEQMKGFGIWDDWENGKRGREK